MPQHKGNLQQCKGKGGRGGTACASPFRVQRGGFVFKLLVPHKLTEAELYSVFSALGGKAGLKHSCPSFPSAFLPAPPFRAWGSMTLVRQPHT